MVNELMDPEKLRQQGAEVLEILAKYWDTTRERNPVPDVQSGQIMAKFPCEPPEKAESWKDILGDVPSHILEGNTDWHHPLFFAYYPTACSYPAVLADILSTGIACVGFSWKSSPACTEVELVMLDWLVKALGLPQHFLNSHEGPGGGIIQPTASDATLVAVLGARGRVLRADELNRQGNPSDGVLSNVMSAVRSSLSNVVKILTGGSIEKKLIMYCSSQAHSSVERAALLANVAVHKVDTDNAYAMRGKDLQSAIEEDKNKGFVPFCVVATLGTTSLCSYDNVKEIGEVCQAEGIWLHVDAAYAGGALICPEFRFMTEGLEHSDSFNFNAHKMLGITFDCSPMWFKDRHKVEAGFKVDPLYLKYSSEGKVPDLRHMQIALGRRFRAIKIWFVMRAFGIEGLQAHVRKMVNNAKRFEGHIRRDPSFEVVHEVTLGLVCFRIQGENARTEKLNSKIDEDGTIHLVPSVADGTYFLRLSISSGNTTEDDIDLAYSVIKRLSTDC